MASRFKLVFLFQSYFITISSASDSISTHVWKDLKTVIWKCKEKAGTAESHNRISLIEWMINGVD